LLNSGRPADPAEVIPLTSAVPAANGPQRYVKQFLSAKNAAAPPEVKFVMERVPQ
jgi:hypothetical protein